MEPSPEKTFWPDMSLDLTDATLVRADFAGIAPRHSVFRRATFFGFTTFFGATFSENADFREAIFNADWDKAFYSKKVSSPTRPSPLELI